MNSLNPLNSSLNPLNFLGGAGPLGGLEGADPLDSLLSLFSNPAAASAGQQQSQVCSCGTAAQGGACGCGGNCCQKNADLGF